MFAVDVEVVAKRPAEDHLDFVAFVGGGVGLLAPGPVVQHPDPNDHQHDGEK